MLIGDPAATSFYSSAKVLFWLTVLGAYGFIEGILRAIRYAPRIFRAVRTKWHNRSIETDYYYAYRESGYRILHPGNIFWHVRKEKVVALKSISELPLSYSWSGEGKLSERVVPDLAITALPQVVGHKGVRKRLTLNPPLEKGGSAEYNFIVECTQNGQPPAPFLSSKSSHRVDVLVLRVVFPPGLEPKKIHYVKRNPDLEEITRERLTDRDFLTGEYRKTIESPEPHLYHRIEWES